MLSKQQFWALFIAILMLGSLFFLFPRSEQKPPQVVNPNVEGATQVNYTASGVDANVIQVFPSAIVLGKTSEAETYAIDSKIMSSNIVLSISNSEFVGDIYRAQVRFKSTSDFQKLQEFLSNTEELSQLGIFPQALIKLGGKTQLKNEETGITLDYEFPMNQVNAIVQLDTLKGDKIKVDLVAIFEGKQLVNALAQETSNLETAQQLVFTGGTYNVSQISDDYAFNTIAKFNEVNKLYSLISFIEEKVGKERVSAKVSPTNLQLKTTLESQYFSEDVNRLLSSFSDIENFTINQDTNEIVLMAKQDSNLFSLSEKVLEEFSSLGYKTGNFIGPNFSLSGEIFGTNLEKIEDINNYAKKQSLKFEILRKVFVNAESIFSEEQNFSYKVPEGNFEAWVSPKVSKDQNVNLSIFMIASKRYGAYSVQAKEADNSFIEAT
ncbi:MAG: hypothetical protein QXD98_01005 [Candidatus Diapherotrites archaeon]